MWLSVCILAVAGCSLVEREPAGEGSFANPSAAQPPANVELELSDSDSETIAETARLHHESYWRGDSDALCTLRAPAVGDYCERLLRAPGDEPPVFVPEHPRLIRVWYIEIVHDDDPPGLAAAALRVREQQGALVVDVAREAVSFENGIDTPSTDELFEVYNAAGALIDAALSENKRGICKQLDPTLLVREPLFGDEQCAALALLTRLRIGSIDVDEEVTRLIALAFVARSHRKASTTELVKIAKKELGVSARPGTRHGARAGRPTVSNAPDAFQAWARVRGGALLEVTLDENGRVDVKTKTRGVGPDLQRLKLGRIVVETLALVENAEGGDTIMLRRIGERWLVAS